MRSLPKIIIVVLMLSLLAGCGKQEAAVQEEPLVPVEAVRAQIADLDHALNATGEIVADVEAAVAPKVSGRVAAVRVKVGDRVSQGQVLVELDATESRHGVSQAEAGVGIAAANVEKAEQGLADAQISYERNKSLYEADAISKSQFEQAESSYNNAQIGLQLAREQLRQAEASLGTASETLANFNITSPMAGLVASINAEVGELAGPQAPVVTVVQLDTVRVKANLSENYIGSIKPGTEVPVTVNTLGKTYTGTVTSVGPRADSMTRAFPVEIKLDNKEGEIKSGMVADLLLSTGTSRGVVAVPVDAVLEREGQFTVFLVEDGQVREVSVKVGVSAGQLTEIKEGIKEGQEVVVKGNRLVADGQRVKVVDGPGGAAQ